jgi:TP901 family phage tail tape measure protein
MAAPININANLNLNPASVNASAKQVQQALGRITGQASEFQKSLDASTARVFAFGATTSVINGITQSFKSLVSTTINVEAKLKEVNSILGAGAAEFNKYRNSIFQVAKTTGQSFNTVAEGAAELARQGLGATESAKRLESALILTRISGLSAEQSVKALTAAMNGFASAGLSAEQVVNKIVAVDTAFAVSAQDLAEGFSRAGSTAEDAGVSFNELLGLITAVEQRTARGGAVIGNAFKSIFTRLSRGSTIEDLKALGVAIDANQTGVQKLKALSDALQNISDPTVASQIKELAGGVFQINVVSAALKDIGDEASVFGKATKEAFNAANQATEKNAALNETLLANLNSLIVSVTSLGEKIGNLTFGPLLKNLVGIATRFSESLDSALDPEKGNKFIQGIFKVIGSFISGPGLAIFTIAFAKIFKTVIKFAREGFKSVMEIGSATERIKQIEGGLIGLLQKDANLRNTLLSTTATQAQKEQAVISAIQKENQLLAQQRDLVSNISNIARRGGVTGFDSSTGSFKGKRGRRFAAGGAGEMEPNLMTAMINEARDAPAGAVPYVTNFRGSPAVMNTSEMQVKIGGREEILTADQIPRFNKGTGQGKRGIISKGKYAFLVPKVGASGTLPASQIGNQKFQGGATVRGPQKNAIKGASDSEEANLEGQVKKSLFSSAAKWTKKLQPLGRQASVKDVQRGFQSIAGAKGALKSAVGSAFEVGITKSLDYNAAQREKGGDFDVRGGSNIGRIQKLFGISETIADFKASKSSGNIKSFYSKVGKERVAGAINKEENENVARKRAIDRDRRKNPQFYTKKGDLKRGSSELDQYDRIAGSLKYFRGVQKGKNFAKGTISNARLAARTGISRFAKGSSPIGPPRGVGNVKINVVDDEVKSRGNRIKTSIKGAGGLGAGFALSGVAAGLDSLSKSAKEAGNSTQAAAADLASSATQFAATGAMIAGPWGAAAGVIIGLGKSIYDSLNLIKDAEKKEKEFAKPSSFYEASLIQEKTFGKGVGLDSVKKRLSQVAEKTGMQDFDLSSELDAAKKAIMATEQGSKEWYEATNKFQRVTERAAKILDSSNKIQEKVNRLKEIQSKIEKERENSIGASIVQAAEAQKQQVTNKSALMQGVQGPFTGFLQRGLDVSGKQADAAKAKGVLEDLKLKLQGEKNPVKIEELREQITEAGKVFKQSVVDGAIFMEQKQTEINNLLRESAKERSQIQKQAIADAISGISKGVRGEKIDLDSVGDFRRDFKAAKSDEERARLIAEFEGTTLSKAENPEMRDALRKAAGIGIDPKLVGRGGIVSEDKLRQLEAVSRLEGGGPALRSKVADTFTSRSGDKRRKELDDVIGALNQQSKFIQDQMNKFGKDFDSQEITSAISETARNIRNAGKNVKNMEAATKEIATVSEEVTKLVESSKSLIKEQKARLDKLEAEKEKTQQEISEIKSQITR